MSESVYLVRIDGTPCINDRSEISMTMEDVEEFQQLWVLMEDAVMAMLGRKLDLKTFTDRSSGRLRFQRICYVKYTNNQID
jgi:hypothetical protein